MRLAQFRVFCIRNGIWFDALDNVRNRWVEFATVSSEEFEEWIEGNVIGCIWK
jgi:hypothetical protein